MRVERKASSGLLSDNLALAVAAVSSLLAGPRAGFFLGLLLGPLLFAAVMEQAHSYTDAWLSIAACGALAGLTMLIWKGGSPSVVRASD